MSDRLLDIGGNHHVFGNKACKDVFHRRLEVLNVFLDCRYDIIGSDIGGRDDGECCFQFLFDMIVVIRNRPLCIDKWDHSKGNCKYRHKERIVDHNGNDASHNHEKQRRSTSNGKLISFAGLFERVLDSSQFHCDLAGFFLTFPRQHLIA